MLDRLASANHDVGIVAVAFFAATAGEYGDATMTSILSRTSSAARSGRGCSLPSAKR